MVKTERSPIPPASLAIEAEKNGSYAEIDVVEQLRNDFNDKCYICELKNLSDPQVEHLRPHKNRTRKELVFDWNNLFYSCPHCNGMKKAKKYDDNILDCCVVDPETMIAHTFKDGKVVVRNLCEDEKAVKTAELIEECFEKENTGIRIMACQHRVKALSNEMSKFYRAIERYLKSKTPLNERSVRVMLRRESAFAAFKRHYVRDTLERYPELEKYII